MLQPYYYSSDDAGAPTLNNATGSLLEVLRACGINGYNVKSVTSIEVASGVATATISAHGFTNVKAQLVAIAGASEAGLNGHKQPLTVSTNSLTYAAPGVPDGTYTGSITARRAPFGLTEVYTGTNVAIFGRAAPEAAAALLRVDDSASGVTDARAISVESATGVDTYTAESPLNSEIAGGFYWRKGANTATAKRWLVVGCAVGFYLFTEANSTDRMIMQQWIDLGSFWPGDAYHTLMTGSGAATGAGSSVSNQSTRAFPLASSYSLTVLAVPRVQRSHAGTGASVQAAVIGPYNQVELGSIGQSDFSYVPILRPLTINSASAAGFRLRGTIPGLAAPMASMPYGNGEIVQTQDGGVYLSALVNGQGAAGNVLLSLLPDW